MSDRSIALSGGRPRTATSVRISWFSVVLIAILAVLVLPPLGLLISQSVTIHTDGGASFTWEHFQNLFQSRRFYLSAWNSVVFSLFATLVSLLFGGMLAWVVERTNAPLKGLAYLTAIISLGTPYVLYVTAWLFLFGRAGPFNDLFAHVFGIRRAFDIYSMWGMIVVEGFLWSPLVFLLLSSTFRAANAEMEDAARMSGASTFEVIWHVSMRFAWPGILAMAIFVFIRNLESFDVPVLIGTPGRIELLTTEIYFSVREVPPLIGHASAFSVLMLAVVAVLLYYYGRVSKISGRYASITGKGYRPRHFDLGRWRPVGGLLILGNFLLVLGLPLVALLWMSLMPFIRPIRAGSLQFLTLDNYARVFASSSYVDLGLRTVMVAAAAATAAVGLTMIAGWWAARRQPGAGAVDQLATMPLVFPGIVLGVAMMEIALRTPFGLYGTVWIIILAFGIRYMPYGMRYAYAATLQVHRELEEAAFVAGGRLPGTFRRVITPLLSPTLFAAWLFIFLISARELSMAILLAGPRSQVMAVAMFDLWENGQGGELAALGLIWAALMTLCASAFYFTMRRRSMEAFG